MALHTRADYLAQQDGAFEPQRTHNWGVEIPTGFTANGQEVISLSIVSGFLPTCVNDEVGISYGNEEVFVPGKAHWESGQLVCRDWVDQPSAETLLRWRRLVYNPATGAINLAKNLKRDVYIILFGPNTQDPYDNLGADGTYQRIWTLQGAWPVRVNPAVQGLDMTSSNMVMMECLLRFDKAYPWFDDTVTGGNYDGGQGLY